MKRTANYYDTVLAKFESAPDKFSEKYELEIDDLGSPPMLEFARAAENPQNPSTEIKFMVMRHSIVGREVRITYDGQEVCRFKMNNVADDLETFPGFKGPALMFLLKQCWMNFLEKLLPPLTMGTSPAATKNQTEQPGSSKKR